jgi:hypothetical protein
LVILGNAVIRVVTITPDDGPRDKSSVERDTCLPTTFGILFTPLSEGTMMALRSHVCRNVPPLSSSFISRILSAPRHISTMPRPYQFHICANWLSAPPGHGIKKKSAPFPPNSAIGAWKDHVLTLPRPGFSKTPGEDFFYVQEVRALFILAFRVS